VPLESVFPRLWMKAASHWQASSVLPYSEFMRFALTQDHIDRLRNEIARTGIGIGPLFRVALDVPAYMSENIAHGWTSGQTKTASKENWDWLMHIYAALPDADDSLGRMPPRQLRELASLKDRQRVRAEFERTGIGGRGIYRLLETKPDGLNREDCIQAVSRPHGKRRASHVKAILDAYSKLPDSDYAPFTDRLRDRLNREIERTGLGMPAIVKALGEDAPPDLNARMVYHWSAGMVKTVKLDYVALVLDMLGTLPDGKAARKPKGRPRVKKSDKAPRISKAQYGLLWEMRKASDLSPHKLLSLRDDVPEGLTPTIINGWLFKKPEAFSKEHFEYVIAAYRDVINASRYV
jgi:hypothetical protein